LDVRKGAVLPETRDLMRRTDALSENGREKKAYSIPGTLMMDGRIRYNFLEGGEKLSAGIFE